MKKRFLFFAIVGFSCSLFAQDSSDENLRWNLSIDGTLTISGSGDMPNYYYNKKSPWAENKNINSIIINTGVTSIGSYAFSNCTGLTSVTIPNSVTSIESFAFSNCTGLTSITIPNSVAKISYNPFSLCKNLNSILVASGNQSYISVNGVLFDKKQTELIACPAGKTGAYTIPNTVTMIATYAFSGCSELTSITIPNSVTSIGHKPFLECENLANITVNWDNPIRINISDDEFKKDAPLSVTLHVPVGKKSQYQLAEGWKQFNIVEQNEISKVISNENDTGIKWNLSADGTLTISGSGDMPDYSKGGSRSPWDESKEKIKTIIINKGITSIGKDAFINCKSLTSVHMPNSVTCIEEGAFLGCTKLPSVTIPNSVKSIKSEAFHSCHSLTSVTIPDGVTTIGIFAFIYCRDLTSVTIPSSVKNIEARVFDSCGKLSDITVNWEVPIKTGVDLFKNVPLSATLHVPAGTKSLYQQAADWKRFNIIEQPNVIPDNIAEQPNAIPVNIAEQPNAIPDNIAEQPNLIPDNIAEQPNLIPDNNYAEINWQLNNSTVNDKHFYIRACITSKSQIETVSITVNGQSFRGTKVVASDGCDFSVNQSVTLAEGGNTIRIEVKNTAGPIASERRVDYQPVAIETNEKRYALVIGNAAYKDNPLKNPVNDATDIADKLRNLNFEVMLLTDNNKREMIDAINNLDIKAKGYDAVMFFYAGHGMQSKSKNYLIPVDVAMGAESDLEFECVDVDRVLAKMEDAQCNIKMIVLDACRNNPFERSWRSGSGRGLLSMNAPTGTLIAYSTAPNTVAADGSSDRNSPYTSALLKALDDKLPVETLFKRVRTEVVKLTGGRQVPWESTSLVGDFYF